MENVVGRGKISVPEFPEGFGTPGSCFSSGLGMCFQFLRAFPSLKIHNWVMLADNGSHLFPWEAGWCLHGEFPDLGAENGEQNPKDSSVPKV